MSVKQNNFIRSISHIGAASGITLATVLCVLWLCAQWFTAKAIDPYIEDVAVSVDTVNHKPILDRIEKTERRVGAIDTNFTYMKYLLEQMATNDQKLRAKNKMNLDREVWR